MYNTIEDIRDYFVTEYQDENFVTDKTGVKMVELVGSTFIADEEAIFGIPNHDYIKREIEWYESQSLFVADIPGVTPSIWTQISSDKGEIQSNYGRLIYSEENHNQYGNALIDLCVNEQSRRSIMIYTRPEIQYEFDKDNMSDFICTNSVQYVIRDGAIHAIVNMRSNDVWAGYRNDYAWQKYVLDKLVFDYNEVLHIGKTKVDVGNKYWQTGSIHMYERNFYLLDHYSKTGEHHISITDYRKLYKK